MVTVIEELKQELSRTFADDLEQAMLKALSYEGIEVDIFGLRQLASSGRLTSVRFTHTPRETFYLLDGYKHLVKTEEGKFEPCFSAGKIVYKIADIYILNTPKE